MKLSKLATAVTATSLAIELLVPTAALAAPTRWNAFPEHDQTSLARANRALLNQPGSDQVELLAEFPNYDNGTWRDPNQVHLFPTSTSASWPMTELNNASRHCGRVEDLVDTVNRTQDAVMQIFASGLDELVDLAEMKADLDTFRINNESAFTVLASKESALATTQSQIDAIEVLIEQVDILLDEAQAQLEALETQQQALQEEAASGIPDTEEANDLLDEIGSLQATASGFQTAIDALAGAGQDTSVMESLLAGTNAQIADLQADLDVLVAAHRAEAAAAAAALQPAVDAASATVSDYFVEKTENANLLLGFRRAYIDGLGDQDYLDAKGVVEGYKATLQEYVEFNDLYRSLRDPIIRDAYFAINLAKHNFNDLAQLNAGFGQGNFNVWNSDASALPQRIAAFTGSVNAALGQMLDLEMESLTGQSLSKAPFQYQIRDIDPATGTITNTFDMDDLLPAEESFDGWDRLLVVASGDEETISVPTAVTVGDNPVVEEYTIASGRPFARAFVGLGTFCGNVDVEQQDTPAAVASNNPGLSLAVMPTQLSFEPRDLERDPAFNVPVDVKYRRPVTLRPFEGHCSVDSYDYASMKRSWGRKSINILGIYKKTTSWDDRRETYWEKDGFECTFINPELVPEGGKQEIDAMNSMVLNEAYARFVSRTAERFSVEPVTPTELREYKEEHPRHTWAPTMQAICNGDPICLVTIEVFKNINIDVTNGSTSHVKQSTFSLNVDANRVLTIAEPASFSGSFGFEMN